MKQMKSKFWMIFALIIILAVIISVLYIKFGKNSLKESDDNTTKINDDKQNTTVAKTNGENDEYNCKNPIVTAGFHKLETNTASWKLMKKDI